MLLTSHSGSIKQVLISFREWLHSYGECSCDGSEHVERKFSSLSESGFIPTVVISALAIPLVRGVLISFREWLHSYTRWQRKLPRKPVRVLISFREWLHSYTSKNVNAIVRYIASSHLFQRVASFLLLWDLEVSELVLVLFSSLSESGFIPTRVTVKWTKETGFSSHLFQRVASFLLWKEHL